MVQKQPTRVEVQGGLSGTLTAVPPPGEGGHVEVLLGTGQRMLVPAEALVRQSDGSYRLPMSPEEAQKLGLRPSQSTVVPVVAEQMEVGKRSVEKSRVVVHIVPQVRREAVDVPLVEEHIEIERVPVNRFVDGPSPARQEGDVTVVPVFEEVLVVERRLMLKEEVRLIRRKQTRQKRQEVELMTEEVRVLRSES
jgi:stress response protein YsnF